MERHPPLDWPAAPEWSFWVGDIGRFAIFAAILLCTVSVVLNLLARDHPVREKWALLSFVGGGASFFVAIAALGALFVGDQFHYTYVFAHSEAEVDLKYKVAAIWGGQEGSFLLWACCSALFGLLALRAAGAYRRWFCVPYAAFLGALGGILAYETPFRTQAIEGRYLVPPTGQGLAPSLLNYWVTIHPPTIFLGFGSLTVLFCLAFAALVRRDYDSWIKIVRPWALLSLTLVGIGLCMGGFWAYETLGWGGFWAWDPVENTSFVPWILVAGLIHGAFVQIAKGRWVFANLLLGALPFLSFLYGTFLTRSGFLQDTSVHSFAQMNRTALWLLMGLGGLSVAGFLTLWIQRMVQFRRANPRGPEVDEAKRGVDRGSFYAAALWLFSALALCTAFGMSVPLFMSVFGKQPKVVEEHLYHQVLVWVFVPTLLFMAVAPFVGWRKLGVGQVLNRVLNVVAISLGVLGVFMLWSKNAAYGARLDVDARIEFPFGVSVPTMAWIFFLSWLCLFAITASLWRMVELWKRARASIGGLLVHVGVAVSMLGLIVSRGFEQKAQIIVQDGRPAQGLGYLVTYKPSGQNRDFGNRNNTVEFEVTSSRESFVAKPGYYYIDRGDEPKAMVWPYIYGTPFYDLYFTLHPMVVEATDPIEFKKGESKLFEDTLITYSDFVREGEAGMAGTRFIAKVKIETPQGEASAEPAIVIGAQGTEFVPARLGPDYFVSFNRMDAATESATLQLLYVKPIMPIELFFKPLTILVWIGAGIMTLGGLLAAWYRRRSPQSPPPASTEVDQPVAEDAPVSTA